MPYAGGIAAPVISPLRAHITGKPCHCIDTGTYVELETDTPNCHIYFTTDGTKPNPSHQKVNGREVTFRYRAPFTLKPGKRVIKAVAVHRVTKQESHTTCKTYHCEDIHGWNEIDDCIDLESTGVESSGWDSDIEDGLRTRRDRVGKTKDYQKGKNSAVIEAWGPQSYTQETPDQGFSAVNHSGTQINLWGGNPNAPNAFGWDVKAPGNVHFTGGVPTQPALPAPPPPQALPVQHDGVTPQQLNAIANHLTQRMDETRQLTVQDVKKLVDDSSKKKVVETVPVSTDPKCMPISSGNGDFKKQIQHVYAHMLQYARTDATFQSEIGEPKMGKVLSAEFDEGDDSYLLTLHIAKPGFKKPLSFPKAPPPLPKAPPPPKKQVEKPKPAKPVVPEHHEVEKPKVRQAKNEKAPAIELKTEEKPKEEIEEAYFETEEYVQEGTLKPFAAFSATSDAEALRKAMKGLGTDEQAIINVLGKRSISQRAEIYKQFKLKYGKDLKKELDSELSGNFNKICQNLCIGAVEYDCQELRRAMKGLGTDEDCLIEIIVSRTNKQIEDIKRTYKNLFNRDLEEDVMSETSGHFKRVLVSQLQGARPEGHDFDRTLAKNDAEELRAAGEGKWGTDESKFNEILCSRSNSHLRAVFQEYESLSSKTIEEAIKSEMSGDLMSAMVTMVRVIQNKPRYFAVALHKSMKGLGTDDGTLLRVIITRCEIDMVQIKAAFQAEFGQSLAEFIRDDTSGDYRKILLALIGES